jgi:hypothetical protein
VGVLRVVRRRRLRRRRGHPGARAERRRDLASAGGDSDLPAGATRPRLVRSPRPVDIPTRQRTRAPTSSAAGDWSPPPVPRVAASAPGLQRGGASAPVALARATVGGGYCCDAPQRRRPPGGALAGTSTRSLGTFGDRHLTGVIRHPATGTRNHNAEPTSRRGAGDDPRRVLTDAAVMPTCRASGRRRCATTCSAMTRRLTLRRCGASRSRWNSSSACCVLFHQDPFGLPDDVSRGEGLLPRLGLGLVGSAARACVRAPRRRAPPRRSSMRSAWCPKWPPTSAYNMRPPPSAVPRRPARR